MNYSNRNEYTYNRQDYGKNDYGYDQGRNENEKEDWGKQNNLYPQDCPTFIFEGTIRKCEDKEHDDCDKKDKDDKKDKNDKCDKHDCDCKEDKNDKNDCCACNCRQNRPCCRPCFPCLPCFPCFCRPFNCNCRNNRQEHDFCDCKKDWDCEKKENRGCHEDNKRPCRQNDCDKKEHDNWNNNHFSFSGCIEIRNCNKRF